MNVCPCCGSGIDAPVAVDLNTNTLSTRGETVRLTAREAEIMSILAKAYPAAATYQKIFAGLYGAGGGPDDPLNSLSVMLVRLRRLLAPLGISILTQHGKSLRLETPSKSQSAA